MLSWIKKKLLRSRDQETQPAPTYSEQYTSTPVQPDGVLELYKCGQIEQAEQLAASMLANNVKDIDARLVQAKIAIDRRQFLVAVRMLRAALNDASSRADLYAVLGQACIGSGNFRDGIAALNRAIELDSDNGVALLQLGKLSLTQAKQADALRYLGRAVKSNPDMADAQLIFADLLRVVGKASEAEVHYRLAIKAQPDNVDALINLGGLLRDAGNGIEAESYLYRAIQLRPTLAPACFNLGMLRINQRRWAEAEELLGTYLQASPRDVDALYWRGNAMLGLGNMEAARKFYEKAIRNDGKYAPARWGLVIATLPAVCKTDLEQDAAPAMFVKGLRDFESWVRAIKSKDEHLAIGALQPYYLAYVEQDHTSVMRRYGNICVELMSKWATKVNLPPPSDTIRAKCRVGIVSAHIHSHSVWHAIVRGWVEFLDPNKFELHIFYTGNEHDGETEWAKEHVYRMHIGHGLWATWAKVIFDSQVDILIFPEIGMDAVTTRLASLRLARIQLASWGHPISTGIPTIDAFISANAIEPVNADQHYTERLIRLPRLGVCYRPYRTVPNSPDLSQWSIGTGDRLLLCAGTAFKYAPKYDAVMVEIAKRCSPCKLVFFVGRPQQLAQLLEGRLRAAFERAGLQFVDFVRFIPWQNQAEFFSLLQKADVYLDTLGFSGFNTAMQALECGTPVVAYEGRFMRGRLASGILHEAGLKEWIASSPEEFINKVVELCSNNEARNELKRKIGEKFPLLLNDRETVDCLAGHLQQMARSGVKAKL